MVKLEIENRLAWIGLARTEKRNAMNEAMLEAIEHALEQALKDSAVHALILCAQGDFFSAGADLRSMQKAANLSLADNQAQAQQLARVLAAWQQSPKPTLCLVQGPAYGGALGFIAASDYVIASPQAKFCFSEAKLGLIPAVISPYILAVMGFKTCKSLFLSAQPFDVYQAQNYGLVDEIVEQDALKHRATSYAQAWLRHHPTTLATIKAWLEEIKMEKMGPELQQKTAKKLAEVRMTTEAQTALRHFFQEKQK